MCWNPTGINDIADQSIGRFAIEWTTKTGRAKPDLPADAPGIVGRALTRILWNLFQCAINQQSDLSERQSFRPGRWRGRRKRAGLSRFSQQLPLRFRSPAFLNQPFHHARANEYALLLLKDSLALGQPSLSSIDLIPCGRVCPSIAGGFLGQLFLCLGNGGRLCLDSA